MKPLFGVISKPEDLDPAGRIARTSMKLAALRVGEMASQDDLTNSLISANYMSKITSSNTCFRQIHCLFKVSVKILT